MSFSLILMLVAVVMMDMQPVHATNNYEYELYVDDFELWMLRGWDTYGNPPWLNATDYDENYIESSEPDGLIGNFTFEDITLPSDQGIARVVLEGYCQYPEGYDESLDIDVFSVGPRIEWLGSLWGTEDWGWHTPRWIGNRDVTDIIPETRTEEGLNNLQVLLFMYWLNHGDAPTMRVDCLRLKVYTAISATIDIDPDTLKLTSSARKLKCNVTLPSGFSASDINQSTILLDNLIAPIWFDQPTDGSLMVKFNMTTVKEHIENDLLKEEPLPQDVKLYVTFCLKNDGQSFIGNDTITVISCPKH